VPTRGRGWAGRGVWLTGELVMASFGQLLRQLRTSAGLSQEKLAQAGALSTRTVSVSFPP
jgi:ribosome-binding protein aMBF1 (putative translation factor)